MQLPATLPYCGLAPGPGTLLARFNLEPLLLAALLLLFWLLLRLSPKGQRAAGLAVCADPNKVPFSRRTGEGFENKLVRILARDLHSKVSCVWWAQRRGFARHPSRMCAATCGRWCRRGLPAWRPRSLTTPRATCT